MGFPPSSGEKRHLVRLFHRIAATMKAVPLVMHSVVAPDCTNKVVDLVVDADEIFLSATSPSRPPRRHFRRGYRPTITLEILPPSQQRESSMRRRLPFGPIQSPKIEMERFKD